MIKIAPSLLSADFINLGKDILSIKESNADIIHLDIMDGHFVPNITFGPFIVEQIKKNSDLPLDTHLMITDAPKYIEDFAKAGSDMITVHAEAETHLHRTLQSIKKLGLKAGVALNPHTDIGFMKYVADLVDLVLVMSVNPGFGGQSFIKSASLKIKELSLLKEENNLKFDISVDGGINSETAPEVISAGATILVTGSAFFKLPENERKMFVQKLKSF